MKNFILSSVHQGYKTVEDQQVSGDAFLIKARVYATFILDELINLSTLTPWKTTFYHLLSYFWNQITIGFFNKTALQQTQLAQ